MLKREVASMLTFYGISPIHAGAGSSTSVVDLPIQRERHTNWPHVQASSVKGALRQHFRRFAENEVKDGKKAKEFINYIFGNDSDNDSSNLIKDKEDKIINTAGIISVSDAKLLAFPMRSNIAPFVHITCPAILKRLLDDLDFCGAKQEKIQIPPIQKEQTLVLSNNEEIKEDVLLEDLILRTNPKSEFNFDKIIKDYFEPSGIENLLLIHDEDFSYCVSYCTEIQTHIKIDTKAGTAKEGALRYQELLPANTLLYSVVYYSASAFDTVLQAETVKSTVQNNIKGFMQIGGDETLGRGICKIQWHSFNEQGA